MRWLRSRLVTRMWVCRASNAIWSRVLRRYSDACSSCHIAVQRRSRLVTKTKASVMVHCWRPIIRRYWSRIDRTIGSGALLRTHRQSRNLQWWWSTIERVQRRARACRAGLAAPGPENIRGRAFSVTIVTFCTLLSRPRPHTGPEGSTS